MLTLRLTVPTATEPRVIRLVKPLTTFGRSPDNDIVVSDPQVKPSHAYFSRGEQDVTIVAVDGDVLVLAGMAVGSAMGFLGPWLHRKQGPRAAVYPVVLSSRQSGPHGTSGVMVGLGLQGTAP